MGNRLTEARDIIAEIMERAGLDACTRFYGKGIEHGGYRHSDGPMAVYAVIVREQRAALTAAGWTLAPPGSRVVPEGGVDAETVERAAKAISRMIPLYGESWLEPHGHNFPKQYSAREQRLIRGIATAALRALAEAKP